VAIRLPAIGSAFVVFVTVACTSHHDKPCPANEPAFHVQITAADGPLPPDTELTVGYYGTQMESYSLARGGPGNLDICCRPGSATTGALPDVHCGTPLQTDASMIATKHDAATARDAATGPSGASIFDAATDLDAAAARDGALDATASKMRDASTEEPGESRDAGSSTKASGPTAIFCDLWTNGYATVVVNASGYAQLHVLINDAYVPDPRCGVQTVAHHLTLTRADGGLLQ
jgi:hypothetical protein